MLYFTECYPADSCVGYNQKINEIAACRIITILPFAAVDYFLMHLSGRLLRRHMLQILGKFYHQLMTSCCFEVFVQM
jgi:hypothetical protein